MPRRTRPQTAIQAPSKSYGFVIAVCVLLSLAILAVYAQTSDYDFISLDDDTYVYDNAMVKGGLSLAGLRWSFTTFHASNWHPLTWISYQLDSQMFGLNPGAEHAMNVFFHIGATILLFLALARMTKRQWPAAIVAGIFGLHPLHVESVAWVAERKDVLSAFFQMLTLFLYARYTERPDLCRYLVMALALALGVLAKPMAVTLPFVLLLLDYWPLHRFADSRVFWEKIPLLAMSFGDSVLTFLAQRATAIMSLARVPLADRLENAVSAYVSYVVSAIFPVNLAVLYPFHRPLATKLVIAVAILGTVTVFAFLVVRRKPYALIGWLWFLGMLAPVIGIIQVGYQSMADRYMYVPLVGLSIAVVWTIAEFCDLRPALQRTAIAGAALALGVSAGCAYRQVSYWRNSASLFEHTLAVTDGNYVIENSLGIVRESQGREQEAISLFRQAVADAPDYFSALDNLGATLSYRGAHLDEAIALHRRAIAADPKNASGYIHLGHELAQASRLEEAYAELLTALQLQPSSAAAQSDIGVVAGERGNLPEARKHLAEAARLEPGNADTQKNLCVVLQRLNEREQAIDACSAALKVRPDLTDARFLLGTLLAGKGQTAAAENEFARVLAVSPEHPGARAALANLQHSRNP